MILASSKNRRGHLRGFTLIELLVVIAIIGILSAVVLAALNTARSKGNDAAIKSDLDTIRTQAALYYDSNSNAYSTGAFTGNSTAPASTNCLAATSPTSLFSDTNVVAAITGANNAITTGNALCQIANGTAAAPGTTITAGAPATQWTVWAPLSTAGANQGWCVDSNGTSKLGVKPVTGVISCP